MAKRTTIKLTKRRIEGLSTTKKSGARTYDSVVAGFGIQTFPSGRKSYFLDYTAPGSRRRRRITIGSFTDFKTVDQARDEAQRLRRGVRAGVDPLDERKQEREAGCFADWAETFKERGKAVDRWAPRTFGEVERHLKRACEAFGHRRLDAIEQGEIEAWRDKMNAAHGRTEANKSLATVKAALADAVKLHLLSRSPAAHVDRIAGEKPRTRTLSDDEMKALVIAIEQLSDPAFRVAMLWLILTGARRSEVLRAKWGDLRLTPPDRAEWTIPSPKNKEPSVRPIPPELVAKLKELQRDSVFVVGPWSDMQFRRRWLKLRAAAELPEDIHLHDIRRTAGLWFTRTAGLQVAQHALGHKTVSTTAAVYAPLTAEDVRGPQAELGAKILQFAQKASDE